jgi:hypothetical protein
LRKPFYIEGAFFSFFRAFWPFLQVIDRKAKSVLDGRFWKPIIRPTSGAVETENSLVNNELRRFRQQVLQVIEAKRKLKKRC